MLGELLGENTGKRIVRRVLGTNPANARTKSMLIMLQTRAIHRTEVRATERASKISPDGPEAWALCNSRGKITDSRAGTAQPISHWREIACQ